VSSGRYMQVRYFNTSGPCVPELHYMLPPEPRLPGARRLIDQSLYFVVHAPRQTGKTTTLGALARDIAADGRQVALLVSCERAQAWGEDFGGATGAILGAITEEAVAQGPWSGKGARSRSPTRSTGRSPSGSWRNGPRTRSRSSRAASCSPTDGLTSASFSVSSPRSGGRTGRSWGRFWARSQARGPVKKSSGSPEAMWMPYSSPAYLWFVSFDG
jgi:hypothetical protein